MEFMAKLRLLNTNQAALIDDEDYDKCADFNWYANKTKTSIKIRQPGAKIVNLSNFVMNKFGIIYDHKDRNPLNNQKENLREATHAQNGRNKIKQKPIIRKFTSKFKGVCWSERDKVWRANININNKQVSLGVFSLEINAAKAYNEAAIKYHKEFAVLNDLGEVDG